MNSKHFGTLFNNLAFWFSFCGAIYYISKSSLDANTRYAFACALCAVIGAINLREKS